jgi:hypothetical protein
MLLLFRPHSSSGQVTIAPPIVMLRASVSTPVLLTASSQARIDLGASVSTPILLTGSTS